LAAEQAERQKYHNFVETSAASTTPLAKPAGCPGDRPRCNKGFAHLKEEMKRLSRMQQVYEGLDRMRPACDMEESNFE